MHRHNISSVPRRLLLQLKLDPRPRLPKLEREPETQWIKQTSPRCLRA